MAWPAWPVRIIHMLTRMPQRTRRPGSRSSSSVRAGSTAVNSARSGMRIPALTSAVRIAGRRSSGAGSRSARIK
jgi:hypothetical protein